MVVQDWGGVLGLTLPMEMPERFERLLVMNTALATGRTAPSSGFLAWKAFAAANPDLAVGRLLKRAAPSLSDEEAAAYDAPFPDRRYKAGVRRFPEIVPIRELDDHRIGPPGEITRAIQTTFFDAIQARRPEYLEWLDFVELDEPAAKEAVRAADEA